MTTTYSYDADNRLESAVRFVRPGVSVSTAPVVEGQSAQFTITLTNEAQTSIVVSYVTADGTASSGSDYTSVSGSVTFQPGETSKTVSVTTADDSLFEHAETFQLTLSTSSEHAAIVSGTAVASITNNDPAPTLSVADASASEGSIGAFTITLSAVSGASHSVDHATADGTAIAFQDYYPHFGTVTFAPGETVKIVTIALINSVFFEEDETFDFIISGATGGAGYGNASATFTIEDDDAPSFSIADRSVEEGQVATMTVTLSAASSFVHTVRFSTKNDSAVSGSDYVARSGQLTFQPGETSKSFTISSVEDAFHEANERLKVELSSPSGGAILGDGAAWLTISNDDAIARFAVNNPPTVWEKQTATFTITRSGSTPGGQTVNYSTSNGSAAAGSDYSARSGTLTFGAGQTSKTVTVPTIGDTRTEGNETFYLNLSSPSSGSQLADGQGVATIRNNRPPNASNRSYTVETWRFAGFTPSGTDPDGHSVTVSGYTQPSNASVSIQNGALVIEAGGSPGTSSFSYTLRDQFGLTDTGTVTVTVTNPSGGGGGHIPY